MSLIDEALKRAQAAHDEAKKPDESARPWTPPPLPDRRRIARGRAVAIFSLCLAVAVLALTAGWLVRQARRRAVLTASAASRAVPASGALAGLPPITSEVTVAPPPRGTISTSHGPAASRLDATPISGHSRGPGAPTQGSAGSGSPPAPAPRPPAAAATAHLDARDSKGTAEPRSYAGELPLPGGGKVTLEGIAYSETNPVAVLNGKIIAPGGYVEGFTVVRILPDRVELDADGSKVFLTLR